MVLFKPFQRDKVFHIFPNISSLKLNVISQLKFKHVYYVDTTQHYAMGTLPNDIKSSYLIQIICTSSMVSSISIKY